MGTAWGARWAGILDTQAAARILSLLGILLGIDSREAGIRRALRNQDPEERCVEQEADGSGVSQVFDAGRMQSGKPRQRDPSSRAWANRTHGPGSFPETNFLGRVFSQRRVCPCPGERVMRLVRASKG